MKIAICDDSRIILEYMSEKIKEIFQKNKYNVAINNFNNSKDLIKNLNNEFFDVVFLDIDMPEFNGFDVAKKIQDSLTSSIIIFISNLEGSVYESIQFKPFRFIRKNYFEEEICGVIEALIKSLECCNETVTISLPNEQIRIYPSKIMYIECNDKILKVVSNSDVIELRYRLKDMEEILEEYGFIRVHKGYLVNSRYIYRINKKGEIILESGEMIPVSKRRIKDIFEKVAKMVM